MPNITGHILLLIFPLHPMGIPQTRVEMATREDTEKISPAQHPTRGMAALFVTVVGHRKIIHTPNPGGIGMNGIVEITEVMVDQIMEIGMEQIVGVVHIPREEGPIPIGLRNG